MYNYNSSSARVLVSDDNFQRRSSQTQKTENKQVRLKVVERKSQGLAFVNFKNIFMFGIVIFAICMMINTQTKINEINDQITHVRKEITQLESEQVEMQSSLESTLSIKNVTKIAEQELGMHRADQYQVVHVRIYEDDKVQVTQLEPEGFSEEVETFVARIARYFKGVTNEE